MDYQQINSDVATKTKTLVTRLRAEQDRLGMKHEPDSLKKITTKQSYKNGLVNRIRIRFKKSGVFVHKGVGRGTPASQVGNTNRKPKEWFNPLVEEFADQLAESMADQLLEVTFDKLKIK